MQTNLYLSSYKKIPHLFLIGFLLIFSFVCFPTFAQGAPRQVLKGEATGKVLLGGEAYGTGKVTFTNVAGDASLVVNCDKDISAGANSATCIGTNVNGFFSGGPNGYAIFGEGSQMINLQLVDGKKFTYAQGGVTAEFEVVDASIFNNWDSVDEDKDVYEPEEYDPDAPLTDSRARAADIDGQVEIACPPDFEVWNVLKRNTVIYNHCRLKTGEESTLRISFSDMTTFVMRPESEVVINQAIKEKSNLQLIFGGFWANVKKMAKGEDIFFKGSQAVAGIKGTTFIMEDDGETTTLKVIEGVVNFKSKTKQDSVDVAGGKMISANASGLSKELAFDENTEIKFWDNNQPAPNKIVETNPVDKSYYLYIGGAGVLVVIIFIIILVFSKRKKA